MTARQMDMTDSKRLSALLADVAPVAADDDCAVFGLTTDSRRVRPGDAFFACHGQQVAGHQFIEDAVRYGAVAVIYETPADHLPKLPVKIPVIAVDGLAGKIGIVAERFYQHPSRDLFVVGVTGTNGKTSTSHFIAHCLSKGVATPSGLIGTLGSGLYGNLNPGIHTTPDPVALHALLAEIRDAGAKDAVMEVSSHGLAQGRVNGVEFTVAVFTNLTRDHLDYHGDMMRYAAAKRRLFMWPTLKTAVVNMDDVESVALLPLIPPSARVIGYSLRTRNNTDSPRLLHLVGQIERADAQGLQLNIEGDFGRGTLNSALIGRFNASNLLAALAVLLSRGLSLDDATARLNTVRPVPGRLENFGGKDKPLAVVDYAHTPDALEQVLLTLRPLCRGQLWCVFGCGGNRDRGKRPQMGAIAERYADHVILTDDNPRQEDPTSITDEILAGIHVKSRVQIIHHRAEAIAYAVGRAQRDDVVLIAGKGHEDYQEIKGQRRAFSDRVEVTELLGAVESSTP